VTAAGVHAPPAGAPPAPPARPALGMPRLVWLHLRSRRVPIAAGLLTGLAAVLWSSLHWHWNIAGGPAMALLTPLCVQVGAAAVIAVTTYGPFGDQEKTTGQWLPWLRLGAAAALTLAAIGLLSLGALAGSLPLGDLAMARNVAGVTGVGLLSAVVLGGALAWVGPMAYLLVAETTIPSTWQPSWVWLAHPWWDTDTRLWAAAVCAAGLAAMTVFGPRATTRD